MATWINKITWNVSLESQNYLSRKQPLRSPRPTVFDPGNSMAYSHLQKFSLYTKEKVAWSTLYSWSRLAITQNRKICTKEQQGRWSQIMSEITSWCCLANNIGTGLHFTERPWQNHISSLFLRYLLWKIRITSLSSPIAAFGTLEMKIIMWKARARSIKVRRGLGLKVIDRSTWLVQIS